MNDKRKRTFNPQIVAAIITGVAMLLAALITIFPQLRPWSGPATKQERTTSSIPEKITKPEDVSPLPRNTAEQRFSIRFDLIQELNQGLSTSFELEYTVTSICFSPDGRFLFSGTKGTVELWDVRTWKLNRMMMAKQVSKVVCSPDNKSFVAAVEGDRGIFEGKLIIYDARTWKIKNTFIGPTHKLRSVAISPLGKLIAGTCGTIMQTRPENRLEAQGYVIVWDMYEETVVWREVFGAISVNSIAFSPNGQFLVTGDDEDVKVWAATTWDQVATLKRQRIPGLEVRDFVQSVVFSPNGKVLASGNSDGTLILWDTKTWSEKLTLRGHERDHEVTSLAFSPNGKLLASGSLDKTVNLWNAERGTLEAQVKHNNFVTTVAFSPDGKILASGGYDSKIKLWNLAGR